MFLGRIKTLILICTLTPLLILSICIVTVTIHDSKNKEVIHSQTTLRLMEKQISTKLDQYSVLSNEIYTQYLEDLSQGVSDRNLYSNIIAHYAELKELYPELVGITLYTEDEYSGPSTKQHERLRGESSKHQILIDESGYIVFYTPIQASDNIGFKLRFSFWTLQEELKELSDGQLSNIFLFDSRGNELRPLHIYKPSSLEQETGSKFDEVLQMTDNASYGFLPLRNIKSYLSFRTIQSENWYIMMLIPRSYILSSLIRPLQILIPAILISLFLGAILILYLNLSLIRPLQNLLAGMRKTASSPGSYNNTEQKLSEVKPLQSEFCRMDKALGNLLSKVHEESRMRQESEIQALQSQICPHFLFNSLDSISWMAQLEGAEDISRMILSLSSLMDLHIGREGRTLITLEKEIQSLKDYLFLENFKRDQKISLEITGDENKMDYPLPPLILQPLLENSIRHNKDFKDELKIQLNWFSSDETFIITMNDNGRGCKNISLGSSYGIGISNSLKRIQLHYGEQYGFQINNEINNGFSISLKLPQIQLSKAILEEKGIMSCV